MSLVRLKGTVDATGHLTVEVPWGLKPGEIEVFINSETPPRPTREEFIRSLHDTFGITPNFERPSQCEMLA